MSTNKSTKETAEQEVIIWIENGIGRVRLNRPKALNALNFNMAETILSALTQWRDNDAIKAVLIESAGDRAFCAGGDIAEVYHSRDTDITKADDYFTAEYNLNLTIDKYPKPYIALMDGIVMGGGVGLSGHGSHRIVTERTMLAMPECAIGIIPDVGATWLLHNAPGEIGKWLGMTGARLNGADAIYAGFADTFMQSEKLETLIQKIIDGDTIENAIADLSEAVPNSILASLQGDINEAFSKNTALECVAHLKDIIEQDNSTAKEWAQKCLDAIEHGAPFATVATFEAQVLCSKLSSVKDALTLEYRYIFNAVRATDFFEGVRAMLIDKDKDPKWNPKTLKDVNIDEVQACFASLGENELKI